MTGCEFIKCPDYINGVCTNLLDFVNQETGEDMCPRNINAISREEWIANNPTLRPIPQ